jgi:hypothetical protein
VKVFLCFLIVNLSSFGWGQDHAFYKKTYSNFGEEIANKQYNLAKKSLYGLGIWSSTNIVFGLIARANSQAENLYFHEMNAGFNTVNFAIAGLGLLTLKRVEPNLEVLLNSQRKYENVYLFNAFLDVAYAFGGVAMWNSGIQQGGTGSRLVGYGRSILLQGSFLFVYDLFLYVKYRQLTRKLWQGQNQLNISASMGGLRMSLMF